MDTNWNNIIQGAETFADTDSIFMDSALGNWLFPGFQQKKEFGQQIALQEMQNEWNAAPNQMSQMKKAGINANTAAAGIAGSGNNPSVASPNSAVGAGAAGIGSAAQAAGAVNDAVDSAVNAYEKIVLTGVEKDRRKAEIRNLLSAALHNDWLAYSISEMLPLQKDNERADTYLKLANFDKAREEKQLILKRVDEAKENIIRIRNEASLLEKQGNLVDAEKLKVDAQTLQIGLQNDELQWDKDWREKYRYKSDVPIDVALEQAMVNGASDEVVNSIGNSIKQISYNQQSGYNAAEIEDAFDKAYNQGLGDNASAAEYAHMKFQIDIAKIAISAYLEALASGAKDPITFVIQKLMVPSLKGTAEEFEKDVHKPHPQPRKR